MSDALPPHEPEHARLPCPSLSPWVYSDLGTLSQWTQPSDHSILCHPLFLLPSIFPSIRIFSNEFTLHIRWPEYWSFSFSISLFNEHSGLISFKIDWFDPLVVQRILKSLLQHHSLKASILQCSTFFVVQLSHPYMTTGETIALTIWTLSQKWYLCNLICYLGLVKYRTTIYVSMLFWGGFPGRTDS